MALPSPFVLHHLHQESLPAGHVEGIDEALEGAQPKDFVDVHPMRERQRGQRQRLQHRQCLRHQQHLPPVPAGPPTRRQRAPAERWESAPRSPPRPAESPSRSAGKPASAVAMRVIQVPISEMLWPPKKSRKLRCLSARHACEKPGKALLPAISAELSAIAASFNCSSGSLKTFALLRILPGRFTPVSKESDQSCAMRVPTASSSKSSQLATQAAATPRSCEPRPPVRAGRTLTEAGWFLRRSQAPSSGRLPARELHHRCHASDRRCAARSATMAEAVTAVNVDKSSRAFSHSPAISAATTECSGPYSGMRAPSRPSDHNQIASPGSFLIFASSSLPSEARVLAEQVLKACNQTPRLVLELPVYAALLLAVRDALVCLR